MKKVAVAWLFLLLFLLLLASCRSLGNYTADMPDLLVGRIRLRLENYGPRTGTYSTGIFAMFKNKETGVVSSFGLDSEGYFESSTLDEGTYVFTGLFVGQFALPNTRSFDIPMEVEINIERGQVNVFGDLILTMDQEGKAKSEINVKVEDMKAFFATKTSNSQWLEKHWRPAYSSSRS
jgi:hypothetical protein